MPKLRREWPFCVAPARSPRQRVGKSLKTPMWRYRDADALARSHVLVVPSPASGGTLGNPLNVTSVRQPERAVETLPHDPGELGDRRRSCPLCAVQRQAEAPKRRQFPAMRHVAQSVLADCRSSRRNAKTGFDGRTQARQARCAVCDAPWNALRIEGFDRKTSEYARRVEQNERNRLLRIEFELARGDPHHLLLPEHFTSRRFADRNRQIKLAGAERLHQFMASFNHDFELHPRMGGTERLEDFRQIIFRDVSRCTEANNALDRHTAKRLQRLIVQRQQHAGMI